MNTDIGKTKIYVANTAPLKNEAVFDSVYRLVSEERRNKTDRMRFLKDKCLSLGAEYLLMEACRDFGVDYGKESISPEGGKPYFVKSPVQFNLSHSGERVMCIMSDHAVGCDVQETHPFEMKIARRFFSEGEYRALEACGIQQREDMFLRLWTLKESFMKCTGLGMALPLNDFTVSIDERGIGLKQSVDDSSYFLFEGEAENGYRYAWCVKGMTEEEEKIPGKMTWITIR